MWTIATAPLEGNLTLFFVDRPFARIVYEIHDRRPEIRERVVRDYCIKNVASAVKVSS